MEDSFINNNGAAKLSRSLPLNTEPTLFSASTPESSHSTKAEARPLTASQSQSDYKDHQAWLPVHHRI